MTLTSRIRIAVLSLLAAGLVTFGAGYLGYVAQADAPRYVVVASDYPAPAEASHPYRDTVVAQADTGSAAQPGAPTAPATGSAAAEVPPIADPLTELAALKAKYDALKAAKDSGSKDLLWFAYAALAAAALRVILAAITAYRGDKPKAWAKWTALGLAVPIALFTYYAAGTGLWQAIVMAGAGPGAIVVNELLKRKPKA